MKLRFSLGQLMVASGVLGAVIGCSIRYPQTLTFLGVVSVGTLAFLAGPSMLVEGVARGVRAIRRIPPRIRLAIEIPTLIGLLALSAVT